MNVVEDTGKGLQSGASVLMLLSRSLVLLHVADRRPGPAQRMQVRQGRRPRTMATWPNSV
jgi:hypothetical protein